MSGLADLVAEALNGADGEEDIEKQIEQALACPCVGDLREGPCGPSFVQAFSCFIRSNHENKGMDCIPQFQDFQACLGKHPEHVEAIMDGAENTDEGVTGGAEGANKEGEDITPQKDALAKAGSAAP